MHVHTVPGPPCLKAIDQAQEPLDHVLRLAYRQQSAEYERAHGGRTLPSTPQKVGWSVVTAIAVLCLVASI